MEKKRPSHKWTSDETNLFSQILADPENNFMVTLKKSAFKKHPIVKYLIPLLPNLKKAWEMFSTKEKIQNIEGRRERIQIFFFFIHHNIHIYKLY